MASDGRNRDMARKSAGERVSRLRAKLAAGGTLSADQQAELDAWRPARPGRKPKGERAPVDGGAFGGEPETPEPEAGTDAPPGVAPEFQAPPETMPPAPDAPRVKPRDPGKKPGKTDWRAKYREGAAEGEREATCLQAAGLWIFGVLRLNKAIETAGKTPIIPSAMIAEIRDGGGLALGPIGKAAVLLADKMIPSDLALGPEPLIIGATTLVAGQAWWATRKAKTAAPAKRDPFVSVKPDPTPVAPAAPAAVDPVAPSVVTGYTSAPIVAIVRSSSEAVF